MASRISAGKQILVVGVSLIVGLLLVEAAVRVRQYSKHGTAETGNSLYERDEAAGLNVPIPNATQGPIHINSHGFRGAEFENPKPEGRIRLAFLGGSTTFCAETSSDETTWPHQVVEMLRKSFPEASFDYVNAGVPAYGVRESARNLEYRVKQTEPDVIVIYHATNDISRDTRELAKEQGLTIGSLGEPSALGKISLAWRLIELNLEVAGRQRSADDAGRETLRFDATILARHFQQELEDLVLAAKRVSPVVAVASFSVKLRREQSPEERVEAANTALYYMPYMSIDELLDVFDAYNEAIRSAAKDTGAVLIDGEQGIPGNSKCFRDSVHLTDEGCRLMAGRVTKALLASDDFQQLVSSRIGGRK